MYDMYDSNMLGFMLYHARWMLDWYDMYARCMLGYAMIDECLGLFGMIDAMLYASVCVS